MGWWVGTGARPRHVQAEQGEQLVLRQVARQLEGNVVHHLVEERLLAPQHAVDALLDGTLADLAEDGDGVLLPPKRSSTYCEKTSALWPSSDSVSSRSTASTSLAHSPVAGRSCRSA
jgi:hypothetical protein